MINIEPSTDPKVNEDVLTILQLAIAKHVYQDKPLYLVKCVNWRKEEVFLVIAESQLILNIPTGAGGTRWPRYYPFINEKHWLGQSTRLGRSTWLIKKIESLNLAKVGCSASKLSEEK